VNLPPVTVAEFAATAKSMALKAVKALGEQEALLTKYDTIVGDGDCGITMKPGATEVETCLNNGSIPTDHPVTMFAAMADASFLVRDEQSMFLLSASSCPRPQSCSNDARMSFHPDRSSPSLDRGLTAGQDT
jgi:hypothetical protein